MVAVYADALDLGGDLEESMPKRFAAGAGVHAVRNKDTNE